MSTTTQRQVTVECQYPDCDTVGRHWEFHHGKYCSNECELKDTGRDALSAWKYSHTRCFTCFARLKEIEPPKPDAAFDVTGAALTYDADEDVVTMQRFSQEHTRQAAIGFQYLTPTAGWGEKQRNQKIATGAICSECGCTDHTTHIPYLTDTHAAAAAVVGYLDAKDEEFDTETLHRRYGATEDIELATGAALEAASD